MLESADKLITVLKKIVISLETLKYNFFIDEYNMKFLMRTREIYFPVLWLIDINPELSNKC